MSNTDTALVVTDPQNDFLSPDGVTWGLVCRSVEANNTVDNIERLLGAAKAGGYTVFVSPRTTTTPPTVTGVSEGQSR